MGFSVCWGRKWALRDSCPISIQVNYVLEKPLVHPTAPSMLESPHALHFGMSYAVEWGQMSNCHGKKPARVTGYPNRPEVMGLSFLAWLENMHMWGGEAGVISSQILSLVLDPGCPAVCFGVSLSRDKFLNSIRYPLGANVIDKNDKKQRWQWL